MNILRESASEWVLVIVSAFSCLAFVAIVAMGYLHVMPEAVEDVLNLSNETAAAYVDGVLSKMLHTFSVVGGVLIFLQIVLIFEFTRKIRRTGAND